MSKFSHITRFAFLIAICIGGIHTAFYFVSEGKTLMALLPIVVVLISAFIYLKHYTEIE